MNREWVEAEERRHDEAIAEIVGEVRSAIAGIGSLTADHVDDATAHVFEMAWLGMTEPLLLMPDGVWFDMACAADLNLRHAMRDALSSARVGELADLLSYAPSRYLDSEAFPIRGDVLVTDPCYVLRDGDWHRFLERMRDGKGGFEPIPSLVARDTLVGDWSCEMLDGNGSKIGSFCADSGMVAAMSLDEALAYNPDFDYHMKRPWTAVVARCLDGTVRFEVDRVETELGGQVLPACRRRGRRRQDGVLDEGGLIAWPMKSI